MKYRNFIEKQYPRELSFLWKSVGICKPRRKFISIHNCVWKIIRKNIYCTLWVNITYYRLNKKNFQIKSTFVARLPPQIEFFIQCVPTQSPSHSFLKPWSRIILFLTFFSSKILKLSTLKSSFRYESCWGQWYNIS